MIGFDSVKSALLTSYQSQKLHHAILLHGKKGIGKASFARDLAAEILGNKISSNPDLFLIEKDAEKKEIGVDKIRSIANFANQTSAISANKFIIIDSACELNKSASNALLKILEEPRPNNFLILISHNLNRILPTIRSRCHLIKVPDLSRQDFNEILRQNNLNFAAKDLEFLSEIFDNSPADAIAFGLEITRFYELFLRSIINKKISEELLKKIAEKNFPFQIFEKSCEFFFNRLSKNIGNTQNNFYFEEEKIFTNLTRKLSAEKIFTISDESLNLLRKTLSLNLDKKLSFINIFNLICY
ncbi:MAG: AAA family ATPase [Proteobacteria bacterium]|nr:AAA family ATPase [Pseudomonadota bacterium]